MIADENGGSGSASSTVLESDPNPRSAPSSGERESKADIRSALLVVAGLIASATYQTVLQPAGFKTNVDNTYTKGFLAGYASWMTGFYGRELAYIVFMSGNTFGFLVSIQMIIFLTRDLRTKDPINPTRDAARGPINPINLPLLLSMALMVQSYYCHAYYLPFQSLEKKFSLKNAELLSVLPLTIPILLLRFQRQFEKVFEFYEKKFYAQGTSSS